MLVRRLSAGGTLSVPTLLNPNRDIGQGMHFVLKMEHSLHIPAYEYYHFQFQVT